VVEATRRNVVKQMIEERHPDTVIVTTVDSFHAKYICMAMRMGCGLSKFEKNGGVHPK